MEKERLTSKDHSPRPITPEDQSYGDVVAQFSNQPTKPKYWFEDFGDYWSCSCGQINRSATCSNCGLERELLRRLFQNNKNGRPDAHALGESSVSVATVKAEGAAAAVDNTDIDQGADNATSGDHDSSAPEGDTPSGIAATDPSQHVEAGPGAKDPNEASDPQIYGDQDPDEYYDEQETIAYNRRKRRTRIIMSVLVLMILMLGAGLAAFYYYGLPEIDRQESMEADAAKDSLVRELPGTLEPLGDTDFDINRNLGDHYYDKKEYEKAIEYYTNALKIKDDESIRHKINAAKFSYVSDNRDKGGAVFEDYLEDLFKAKYSGINDIYYSYYTWKTSIVVNTGANDYSSDMSSINRMYPIYFHTTFSGGPPNETLDLYYEIVWPDGTTEKRAISGRKGSGETVTTTCQYTYPAVPGEGRLTYKLYNNSNNKQLATDSVALQ